MRHYKIPDESVSRLPTYLRGLLLLSEQEKVNVSSKQLADFLGFNAWQIRKDFSYFGGFGTRGVGYNIDRLIKEINKILRLESGHNAVLVGAGNLGSALLAYPGFKAYGFKITAAFDKDPKKIGKTINSITVEDIAKIKVIKRRKIDVGIIAVAREAAQEIADVLIEAGIKGILNFSPNRINVPKRVKVISIDIAMDLARLSYYMPMS